MKTEREASRCPSLLRAAWRLPDIFHVPSDRKERQLRRNFQESHFLLKLALTSGAEGLQEEALDTLAGKAPHY